MPLENLVWIDCEMTGLNPETDALIEVAVLVTDPELNVLGEGVDVVITPPAAALECMSDFVREMHQSSGLLGELASGLTMSQAEEQVLSYVRSHVPEPKKAPLAGNTLSMDRIFLMRDMPTLEEHLHYRNIDVSSIKELVRRWYPRTFFSAPEKKGRHRALGDIQDSINELRFYRETVFVVPPGLTKAEATGVASRYTTKFSPASLVDDRTKKTGE
ncbi:MAG: oligoribonuclease [Propionibacteriaceae bacterium]|nr:oligoribonuclease [Propionibacteriaceae bacterium]